MHLLPHLQAPYLLGCQVDFLLLGLRALHLCHRGMNRVREGSVSGSQVRVGKGLPSKGGLALGTGRRGDVSKQKVGVKMA